MTDLSEIRRAAAEGIAMLPRGYTETDRLRQIASAGLKGWEADQLAIWITHEGWHCDDPDNFFRWVHLKERLGEEVPRVWAEEEEVIEP